MTVDSFVGTLPVTWEISPNSTDGASLTVTNNGYSAIFHSGNIIQNYTIKAEVDAGNFVCGDETEIHMFGPGPMKQAFSAWGNHQRTNAYTRTVYHGFKPDPFTDEMGFHFCFVQRVKGYALNSTDGQTNFYYKSWQYDNQHNDINFAEFVIDSRNNNPIYWGGYANVTNLNSSLMEGYYSVYDIPMSGVRRNGDDIRLDFETGLYCAKSVPTTGASSNPDLGQPFETMTWSHVLSVTTNATGELVFNPQ